MTTPSGSLLSPSVRPVSTSLRDSFPAVASTDPYVSPGLFPRRRFDRSLHRSKTLSPPSIRPTLTSSPGPFSPRRFDRSLHRSGTHSPPSVRPILTSSPGLFPLRRFDRTLHRSGPLRPALTSFLHASLQGQDLLRVTHQKKTADPSYTNIAKILSPGRFIRHFDKKKSGFTGTRTF